jgi:hypothetical protein
VCIRQDGPLPEGGDNMSLSAVENADAKTFSSLLLKSLGNTETFVPSEAGFRFKNSFTGKKSVDVWSILENLNQNGQLSLNGQRFDLLHGYRTKLLSGCARFYFCGR